jgi:hypothetical protein
MKAFVVRKVDDDHTSKNDRETLILLKLEVLYGTEIDIV